MRGSADVPEWERLGSERKYDGWLRVRQDRYRLPNGVEHDWDVLEQGRTIAVVACTDRDTVVLFDQFRPGPHRVLAETPGGLVEDGEDVVAAGRRELLEETGYVPRAVFPVGPEWSAASSERRKYAIVAAGCERVQEPAWEATENGVVREASLPDFVDHVLSGDLSDAGTIARALLVFARTTEAPGAMHDLRERVRRELAR